MKHLTKKSASWLEEAIERVGLLIDKAESAILPELLELESILQHIKEESE